MKHSIESLVAEVSKVTEDHQHFRRIIVGAAAARKKWQGNEEGRGKEKECETEKPQERETGLFANIG
ncbi:unnamed protein product [Lasius platythorax]|uniref:Uncharacterized protein n=1 Tax=Lasius platythorax TaxID=488582 RepID=A0AAV2NJH7_9HYME